MSDRSSNRFAQRVGAVVVARFRLATVVLTLLLVWTFFTIRDPNGVFLSARNLSNLALQITVTGLLALGLVYVLLVGEIDLSVAALSGVAAAITAALVQQNGLSTPLAIAIALGVGVAFQMFQGVVTSFGPPSFIVTLGASLVLNGLLLRILPSTGQFNLSGTPLGEVASAYISPGWAWSVTGTLILGFAIGRASTWHRQRARGLPASATGLVATIVATAAMAAVVLTVFGRYRGVPVPFAVFVALVIVSAYVLGQTRFGTSIYAVGDSREAARRAGVRVHVVVVTAFAIAGLLSALAGIIAASRVLGVSNQSGSGTLLLQAIAATVIGGVSLAGGRGTPAAALLGALVIGSISNGMDLLDYSTSSKMMVQGALLVAAVTIDVVFLRGSIRPSKGR